MALLISLRDQGLPLPASAVIFSPWTDLAGTGNSYHRLAGMDPMLSPEGLDEMAAAYAGAEDLRHPLISPLYANLSGLPPVLIQVGGNEILLDEFDPHGRCHPSRRRQSSPANLPSHVACLPVFWGMDARKPPGGGRCR